MYSPIALFVYNRPEHTKKVLDKLVLNTDSNKSILYVFCDGPKNGLDQKKQLELQLILESIIRENFFKKIEVIRHEENIGLSRSIIYGLNYVFTLHDRIIVLEDDIVPEKGFLRYMNEALVMYKLNDNIGCIHGWNYIFDKNFIKESTFLLRGSDCWGWGTWKERWKLFESDGQKLKDELLNKNLIYSFNRKGTHPFFEMLNDQINGKNDSWAIRWHASLFLANKFCLHPKYPIVMNIGFDGSGTHCGAIEMYQKTIKKIKLNEIVSMEESKEFYESYERIKAKNENNSLKVWLKILLINFYKKIINFL